MTPVTDHAPNRDCETENGQDGADRRRVRFFRMNVTKYISVASALQVSCYPSVKAVLSIARYFAAGIISVVQRGRCCCSRGTCKEGNSLRCDNRLCDGCKNIRCQPGFPQHFSTWSPQAGNCVTSRDRAP